MLRTVTTAVTALFANPNPGVEQDAIAEPTPQINLDVKKILIDQDGGSGHKSAADEEEKDGIPTKRVNTTKANWLNLHSIAQIFKITFIPYLNELSKYNFGKEGAKTWDQAQAEANIKLQTKLISKQYLANFAFAHSFYVNITNLLEKNPNTEQIVSTQQLCIASLLKATSDWNQKNKKNVTLKVILTDLPTIHASHFFNSLKSINQSDLQYAALVLDVPYPAINQGLPSLANYHEELSKLCPSLYNDRTCIPKANIKINFNDGPIDKHFIKIKQRIHEEGAEVVKKDIKSKPIPIKLTNEACEKIKATSLLKENIEETSATDNGLTNLNFKIPPDAWVESILLGSKASVVGTIELVKQIHAFHTDIVKHNPEQERYLFVYCGDDKDLFEQVHDMAKNPEYQMNGKFKIIPLTNQNKDMISRIDCIAECSTIRPGGMKTMEDEAVITGDLFMYSEVSDDIDKEKLIEDPTIALIEWEKGNFKDAQTKLGSDRVHVVNKYTYRQTRLNHFNAKLKKPGNAYNDNHLASTLQKQDSDKKDASLEKIGASYFSKEHRHGFNELKKSNQQIEKMVYGKLYAAGCKAFKTQALPHLSTQHKEIKKEPLTWAIYFADYFMKKTKLSELRSDLINTYQFKSGFDAACCFANAFYEKNVTILTEMDAHLFVEEMMGNISKFSDVVTARNVTIKKWNQLTAMEDEFLHVTGKPGIEVSTYLASNISSYLPEFITLNRQDEIDKLEKIWNQESTSYTQKIENALKYYAPEDIVGKFFSCRRNNGDKADAIIEEIRKLQDNKIAIVRYLHGVRNEFIQDPNIKLSGLFMAVINFIHEKSKDIIINELNTKWALPPLKLGRKIEALLSYSIPKGAPYWEKASAIIEIARKHEDDEAKIIDMLNERHNEMCQDESISSDEMLMITMNFILQNLMGYVMHQSFSLSSIDINAFSTNAHLQDTQLTHTGLSYSHGK